MGKGAALLGLLLAMVGLWVALPFLPSIQEFATNATNMTENPGMASMADTPLIPIINLFPVWALLLLGVCLVIVFVAVSKRG